MGAAVELRGDISADEVREAAKASSDASQCRRLLAIATILDGGSRSEAAKIGGVGLQTVRDWVLRFNAEGAAGLIDRKAPGKPPKLDASQQAALAEIVEAGPIPAVHGVVRWRRKDENAGAKMIHGSGRMTRSRRSKIPPLVTVLVSAGTDSRDGGDVRRGSLSKGSPCLPS